MNMIFKTIQGMILFVAALAAAGVQADTWTDPDTGYTWVYRINGDTAEIYNNGSCAISSSPTGSLTIPSSLGGKPVTSIRSSAFRGCSGLTSVTIPDGVTSIGRSAFEGCSSLTSVVIPDSVTSIGDGAFSGCSELASVTIPDGVTSIGSYAFWNCSGLTSVTIGDGVTSIASSAFEGCSGLTSVTIPDGVTSIGSSAFVGCTGLSSVTIAGSVTNIGAYAFSHCSGLASVTIPDGVTSIGSHAFRNCSGLTSVTIPGGVTSIGDDAFYGCSGLASVTIPDSVTSIGSLAFSGCSGLMSVTIPNSVTSIGWSAFEGCSSLTSVVIPDSVTSIGDSAFLDCSGLTSVTIPDGVTSIGSYAFEGCGGLMSVAIPNSVTSIGYGAFLACNNIREVLVPGWQCRIPFGTVTNLVISSGTVSIGYGAFSECSGLTSVTIPDGVTSIGRSAFEGCSSLTSVVIPDSVTSIGDGAFSGCSELASVTIPNGVTSIRSYAFYGCSGLTSVTIPEGVTNIGHSAFYNCASLSHVMLPDSLVSLDAVGSFDGTPYVWSTVFPDFILSASGKTLYGIKAYDKPYKEISGEFNGRKVKATIFIPATVQSIKDYALGHIYGRPVGGNGWSGWGGACFRFIFTGNKPEMTSKAWLWAWDELESAPATVYFTNSSSGWTWGEDWCGVKTYALNEVSEAYTIGSNLKFGRVYGGGWWDNAVAGVEHEIWDNNDIGLYGDEYALVPVIGTGAINPVIYGDVPSGYLDVSEVWTDQKMFDAFTPKDVPTSNWKTDDDYESRWCYESAKGEWKWPKDIWPDKKVVSGRRWIVVHAKEKNIWSSVWSFRVGLAGTSEISDPIIVVSSEYAECNGLKTKQTPSDFMRGIIFSGYDNFAMWAEAEECYEYSHLDASRLRMQTFEIGNWNAAKMGKTMTLMAALPGAGTLVMSSTDDEDDSPAMKKVFSIKGTGIVSDTEIVKSNDYNSPDYRYNVTNFWKASNASHYRRIEVSGATTLTFASNTDEWECEFNRMYFFPKNVKSVAIDVGYIAHEDHNGAYDYWGRDYVQGYVTGGGVYKSGETATLKAISGNGEEFDHWVVRFGNLTLTDAQKTSPTLSFKVTDAMCGAMEDEAQIFLSAIWKPKYKVTALPSIVGAGTVTGTGRYYEGTTVTLSAVPAKGCTFAKWSDGVTAATRTVTVVPADVERIIYACFVAPGGVPGQDAYAVFFDGNGGDVSESVRMVEKGKAVGTLPTATREKYKFLGWFTAASGGTQVSASTIVKSGVTYYAHWTKLPDDDPTPTPEPAPDPTPDPTPDPDPTPGPGSTPESKDVYVLFEEVDGVAPTTAASEYNGYLYDPNSGEVKGTIQVKVGKPGKKDGKASVKATVVLGAKKVTLKAKGNGKAVIEKAGQTEIELVGGEACTVVLGEEGVSGTYGAYFIDGARNFFASKAKAEQAAANAVLGKWQGPVNVVWGGGSVNVAIAKKGKAKVKGTLASGAKVSATAVFLVGEEWCAVPVAAPKANLAFTLWLSRDGRTAIVEGLGDDAKAGKPGVLGKDAAFHVSKAAALWSSISGTVLTDYIPDGVEVSSKGGKWALPKAGNVVYKNGSVDESKLGKNPSGLKLTYKAKDGSFKGSFKVYAVNGGKAKATTVSVTGVMVGTTGYGTAAIKGKKGSVSVTVK